MEKKIEELMCSQCKKSAAWNTPYIDEKGKVWCDRCAKESIGVYLIGIDQHLTDSGFIKLQSHVMHYAYNGCVMSIFMERSGNKPNVNIWTDGGTRSYPFNDDEEIGAFRNPFGLLTDIAINVKAGFTWCTRCGKKLKRDEVAGYPLFAGVACTECWKLHLEHLEDQKKKGHVCSMCHEPYDNCCC